MQGLATAENRKGVTVMTMSVMNFFTRQFPADGGDALRPRAVRHRDASSVRIDAAVSVRGGVKGYRSVDDAPNPEDRPAVLAVQPPPPVSRTAASGCPCGLASSNGDRTIQLCLDSSESGHGQR